MYGTQDNTHTHTHTHKRTQLVEGKRKRWCLYVCLWEKMYHVSLIVGFYTACLTIIAFW